MPALGAVSSLVTSCAVGVASDLAKTPDDRSRMLPVHPALAGLFPRGGLRRGSTVVVRGSTSLLFALLAQATETGSWAALVGMPNLGLRAAAELGVAVDHLALVRHPGADLPKVIAALLDGMDLVAVDPARLTDSQLHRLSARARHRSAVLVSTGAWPGADLELTQEAAGWSGLGWGHGALATREVHLRARGRGVATRPVEAWLRLPAEDGAPFEPDWKASPQLNLVPPESAGDRLEPPAGRTAAPDPSRPNATQEDSFEPIAEPLDPLWTDGREDSFGSIVASRGGPSVVSSWTDAWEDSFEPIVAPRDGPAVVPSRPDAREDSFEPFVATWGEPAADPLRPDAQEDSFEPFAVPRVEPAVVSSWSGVLEGSSGSMTAPRDEPPVDPSRPDVRQGSSEPIAASPGEPPVDPSWSDAQKDSFEPIAAPRDEPPADLSWSDSFERPGQPIVAPRTELPPPPENPRLASARRDSLPLGVPARRINASGGPFEPVSPSNGPFEARQPAETP
jgi:hypothetical protein